MSESAGSLPFFQMPKMHLRKQKFIIILPAVWTLQKYHRIMNGNPTDYASQRKITDMRCKTATSQDLHKHALFLMKINSPAL